MLLVGAFVFKFILQAIISSVVMKSIYAVGSLYVGTKFVTDMLLVWELRKYFSVQFLIIESENIFSYAGLKRMALIATVLRLCLVSLQQLSRRLCRR